MKHLYLAISFICCLSVTAAAQDSVPVHEIEGQYITEWLLLGPFVPNDLSTDFLAEAGGEASADPHEGDTFTTAAGETLTWKRYSFHTDDIDLLVGLDVRGRATAYAFCILNSEEVGGGEIRLRSDHQVSVFLNGRQEYPQPQENTNRASDEKIFEIDFLAGENRCLVKVSPGRGRSSFEMRVLPPTRAVISGVVRNHTGAPFPNASLRLEQNGKEIGKATSDASGNYWLGVFPVRGPYDLSATSGNLGCWKSAIHLQEKQRLSLNLELEETNNISGRLLMLDSQTPHVAVVVQAVRISDSKSEVISTTLSDEDGKYRFINLKPGKYRVRCQIPGGNVYYQPTQPKNWSAHTQSESSAALGEILAMGRGASSKDVDFRIAPFKKGTWKTYTTLDGLVNNAAFTIYRDPSGAMWFGTPNGVSLYDGEAFTNLTEKDGLVSDRVRAIYRDPDGVMWFGTEGGISRYDGQTFTNFTDKDGLAHRRVYAICRDPAGTMWFGTGGGVSCYNAHRFVNLTKKDGLVDDHIRTIYREADGGMWFGTLRGVSYYDGKTFVNFRKKDGLAEDQVEAIYRDSHGVMWFGTWGSGISRYDGHQFINFTGKDGLPDGHIAAIYGDSAGGIWFSTWRGVSRYDGRQFINFTQKDGLAHNFGGDICPEPDGMIWIATRRGISRYDKHGIISFSIKDGLNLPELAFGVASVQSTPERVMWFGTWAKGVFRYDGHQFINFTEKDGLAGQRVRNIHRDKDGVMWFGTDGGVSRYDGRKFVNLTEKDGLVHNSVYAMSHASDTEVWFGTDGGVSRYDGRKFVNLTEKDGLAHNSVYAISHVSDTEVWFGTRNGLSRYDGQQLVSFTEKDGLADQNVWEIARTPDGVLWFGGAHGISRYDVREGISTRKQQRFVDLTPKDRSAHHHFWAIHCDPKGIVWFGRSDGNVGISAYDGIAWTSLDARDGIGGNDVYSIHQDSDGFLWFGTENGVTRYRRNTTPPSVRIESVHTTHKLYTTDFRTGKFEAPIEPVTAKKPITIKYNAIDFLTQPEKRQYRVGIAEGDATEVAFAKNADGWQAPIRADSYEHTFDRPGTYTLAVQAINRDLNYSQPAMLTLTVIPPWYLNGWIIFPTAGVFFALIIAAIALRLHYIAQRQKAQRLEVEREIAKASERERQQIGQDLHDDLGQHLTGVALLSKVLAQNRTENPSVDFSEQSTQISTLINEAINKTRNLAKGLVPVELHENGLMAALEELADATENQRGMPCRFVCPSTVHIREDTTAVYLYRIAQEAVNNAVKHSHATEVVIELTTVNRDVTMTIKDNGSGFRESSNAEGLGIRLMRYRASIIGGTFEIQSGEDGGTVVVCSFRNQDSPRRTL